MSNASVIRRQRSPTPDESPLSVSQIHTILSNDRRRLAIEEVKLADEAVSVREVSEKIATYESGESPPPRKLRQSVYVSLIQTHLPKLESAGVIAYDEQQKTITEGTEIPRISRHMGISAHSGMSFDCSVTCIGACLGMLAIAMGAVGWAFGVSAVSLIFWSASLILAIAIIASYFFPNLQERVATHF